MARLDFPLRRKVRHIAMQFARGPGPSNSPARAQDQAALVA
jgi:hypothetical protein